jgi:Cu2+-exporting ATPase
MHSMEELRRRFLVSMIVTIPILLLSPALQSWFGFRIGFPYAEWVIFILATFIYLYGGWPFLTMAIREIRKLRPGMMTLISMAISVAYFYSALSLLFSGRSSFFWELATLIDIMLIGHYLEAKSLLGAADALEELVKMMPRSASRIRKDGTMEEVPIERLRPGDRILIRPGERVPADGKVFSGESLADESFLTGESKPVSKRPGSFLYMGSTNIDGALRAEILKNGVESYLSQVIQMVREAQRSRSKTQDLANRAAGWLFYGAVGSGALTFAVWSLLSSPADAVLRTVTVLIIACPHALGLAVPLVVSISTTLAAKRGILVRNRQAFETLRGVDVVCFDKTGTLTEGRLSVEKVVTIGEENELLRIAVSLEENSEHSIARAIVEHAGKLGIVPTPVTGFSIIPGVGASGIVEGKRIELGGIRMLDRNRPELPQELIVYREIPFTTVWIAVDGKVVGVILLGDRVRHSAHEAVDLLASMGKEIWMLTGDNTAIAGAVAESCGIRNYRAQLMPDEKRTFIQTLRNEGKSVAMVGDGINDAPSLLTANIGIAIGAGTDIAIESADLILTRSDPMSVVHAIGLSAATYRKMLQNLWWASGYNLIAIPLAAGLVSPWGLVVDPAVGAILMSVSTVIVALNARLLSRDARMMKKG